MLLDLVDTLGGRCELAGAGPEIASRIPSPSGTIPRKPRCSGAITLSSRVPTADTDSTTAEAISMASAAARRRATSEPSVVRMMGTPPAMAIQAVSRMLVNPSFSIDPQLGVGGRTPRPRKLIPASIPITTGMSIEARITKGPITLGRI